MSADKLPLLLSEEQIEEVSDLGVAWCNEQGFKVLCDQALAAITLERDRDELKRELATALEDAKRWRFAKSSSLCLLGVWADDEKMHTIVGNDTADATIDSARKG